ncbi:S-layer homology domain-containing protein [Alkalihalobacillus sp. MEB130]|uniref:S-layer homology domain-containing protein n=1 Tax=Alkalihalobacillus sp. MEB130 TaxID=2976704 RepID=UPI0028DE3905|nr:S-layer homology domain-containing protein [Alkalihalobacillus sp. MEB130]MDT8858874.1 S-layer homology domain-containing protein [Alkalihalobacillus sp. MEB130]
MVKLTSKIVLSMILVLSLLAVESKSAYAALFDPLPFEDRVSGRNSNAYLPMKVRPTTQEQERFIQEIAPHAVRASERWGIPASAIIGMSIIESGFGTTRTAHFANNLFGIKVWGGNSSNAWQLQGQPDEDFEPIPIIENLGPDRIIFDETKRRDNWYRQFSSYEESVNFLAGTLLLNQRYGFARDQYRTRINNGMSIENASREYLFDIAHAGYNHLGGNYYRDTVGRIMTQWNLFQYDRRTEEKTGNTNTNTNNNTNTNTNTNGSVFRDINGYWAEESILLAAEKGWINGHSDQTFRPSNHLTRAQAATILTNFLKLESTNRTVQFHDVSNNFWALDSINLVAQNRIMNGNSSGNFSPGTNVTRAQVAQIFYNAGFYSQSSSNKSSAFTDVRNDHWAITAIETMRQEGIITGFSDGTFKPNQPITRAQMTVIIHRLYENNEELRK